MSKEINSIMIKPAKDFTPNQRRLDDHWAVCIFMSVKPPICPICDDLSRIVIEEENI